MPVKKNTFSVILMAMAIVSIVISSWQYQNDVGDIPWGETNFLSKCTSYPLKYTRRKHTN
jgi:hypothetical protein